MHDVVITNKGNFNIKWSFSSNFLLWEKTPHTFELFWFADYWNINLHDDNITPVNEMMSLD